MAGSADACGGGAAARAGASYDDGSRCFLRSLDGRQQFCCRKRVNLSVETVRMCIAEIERGQEHPQRDSPSSHNFEICMSYSSALRHKSLGGRNQVQVTVGSQNLKDGRQLCGL